MGLESEVNEFSFRNISYVRMQLYAWICCMMKSNVSKIEHWEALKQEVNKEGYYTKFISQANNSPNHIYLQV